jgi:hypothetical protein
LTTVKSIEKSTNARKRIAKKKVKFSLPFRPSICFVPSNSTLLPVWLVLRVGRMCSYHGGAGGGTPQLQLIS